MSLLPWHTKQISLWLELCPDNCMGKDFPIVREKISKAGGLFMLEDLMSVLSGQLTNLFNELQTEQQEGLALDANLTSNLNSLVQTDTVSISTAATTMSTNQNLMSRNYVGGYERDTSYLDAKAAGNAAVRSLEASRDGVLNSLVKALGSDAVWYGSQNMRNAKVMKDTTESHKELFDNLKATIEEHAAEAMVSTDENGDLTEQLFGESTGEKNATNVKPNDEVVLDGNVNLDGVSDVPEPHLSLDVFV